MDTSTVTQSLGGISNLPKTILDEIDPNDPKSKKVWVNQFMDDVMESPAACQLLFEEMSKSKFAIMCLKLYNGNSVGLASAYEHKN